MQVTLAGYSEIVVLQIRDYYVRSQPKIFSLREKGISSLSNAKKFGLRSTALTYSNYAIYNDPLFGPSFGFSDLRIVDHSQMNTGSEAIYSVYSTYNTGTSNVFGRVMNDWTTLEIEVFQII